MTIKEKAKKEGLSMLRLHEVATIRILENPFLSRQKKVKLYDRNVRRTKRLV